MAFDVGAVSEPFDDREPGDLVVEALAVLQAALPDWVPRNGSPEVIYLEALAYVGAEIINSANDTVGAVVEGVLENLFGVARGTGTQAAGELTVTFDSAVSTTIPEGSTFQLPEYGVELMSTAEVVVTSTNVATVSVVTTEATSAVNGVDDPAAVDILDSIPNALSVAISSPMAGGADVEGDDEYKARAAFKLGLVTNSLVVLDHYSSYCRLSGLCSNATTIGAWDGADIGTAGDDGGYVTSAVYGLGGLVSAEDKATLAADMQVITADGVTVSVIDAALETVAVTATVASIPGTDTATVRAAVEAALTAWLDPATWTFGETVRTTDAIVVIAAADGVDSVIALTLPAADVTLTADQVATAGALTISVI